MQVIIEPYAALSILDLALRVDKQERPSGLLLGNISKSVVAVKNFVPKAKTDDPLRYLIQRSCPNERIVGWYSFDPELASVQGVNAALPAILLAVHLPSAASPDVKLQAYNVSKLQLGELETDVRVFTPLPTEVKSMTPAGSVVVDTIVRHLFPAGAAASDPAALSAIEKGGDVFAELQQLRRNLRAAQAYCSAAASGKVAGDAATGRELASVLSMDMAQLSASSTMANELEESSQDALMLAYVMKLLGQKVEELRHTYHETQASIVAAEDESRRAAEAAAAAAAAAAEAEAADEEDEEEADE